MRALFARGPKDALPRARRVDHAIKYRFRATSGCTVSLKYSGRRRVTDQMKFQMIRPVQQFFNRITQRKRPG
jgi:hypothetical protein